jgi:hypothetical protein
MVIRKNVNHLWLSGKLGVSSYKDYLPEKGFLLIILIALIVFVLLPALPVYAQFNSRPDNGIPAFNATEILSRLSHNVSGAYENSALGFKINFPQGWSGIEANVMVNFVQVSPSGISPDKIASQFQNQSVSISITGIPKAMLELAMPLVSAFKMNDSTLFGNSSLMDITENVKQFANCKLISSSIIKLNKIITEEKTNECSPGGQYVKTKSYDFATEKGIVTISYSANSQRDYNFYLPKFDESIKSLTVSMPADVRTFGQELLGVTSNSFDVKLPGAVHTIRIDSTQNVSNFSFNPLEKVITFTTGAGKGIFGIAESRISIGKLLNGPYSVVMDGNKVEDFVTIDDMIDNGTVLDLTHPQGLHTFVISGK